MNSQIRKWTEEYLGSETFFDHSEKKYVKRLNQLRADLMKSQRGLRETSHGVIIIISGVDGAGKGEAIRLLNEWLDPRDLATHSFWSLSDEALRRPLFWRYWNALPRRGKIAIWFGGWYASPLIDAASRRLSSQQLEDALGDIHNQEKTLTEDGAVILKFWFHLTKSEQEKRLRHLYEKPQAHWRAMADDWKHHSLYDHFEETASTLISHTHQRGCPWFFVPSSNPSQRDLIFASLLSKSLQKCIEDQTIPFPKNASFSEWHPSQDRALSGVNLNQRLKKDVYETQLIEGQSRLHRLFWAAYEKRIATALVFEGWDAAGKGGAIRRVIAAIDPRLFRIVQVGPPSIEEHSYHYLWRFWRDLPRDGFITIFDRSWYGRLLVERIEGFAKKAEWQRAYREIREFEKEITGHGMILMKFWIHISKEKQLSRFHSREVIPHKQLKMTNEDWRNRQKWDEYESAVNDMIAFTSEKKAAWTLISGNNKRFARIQTIQTIAQTLEDALNEK